MTIRIARQLRPLTHLPGKKIPLPGTTLALEAYPARLCFYDLSRAEPEKKWDMALDIHGPVSEFTVQLEIAKGLIKVWGKSLKGFYRVYIHGSEKGVGLYFDKVPEKSLVLNVSGEPEHLVHEKEWYVSTSAGSLTPFVPLPLERLSLGSHKSQDWEGVCRRADLVEILPFWYQLGQVLPICPIKRNEGTLSLLNECGDYRQFHRLFLAGFEGVMCPRLLDKDCQGLSLPDVVDKDQSPLPILTGGWRLIRQLFFTENEGRITLLPNLPKEFPSGRLVGLKLPDGSTLNLEWTKKKLRRLSIQAESDGAKQIAFPKELKSFRLKTKKFEKGKRMNCGESIAFEKGTVIYLDNFTK